MYELIDAEEHDYLYIILELADFGQLAKWDFEQELYIRNEKIVDAILKKLNAEGLLLPDDEMSHLE